MNCTYIAHNTPSTMIYYEYTIYKYIFVSAILESIYRWQIERFEHLNSQIKKPWNNEN